MLDFAEGDFSIGCSYFSVVCMIIVLLCKLYFKIVSYFRRRWTLVDRSSCKKKMQTDG